MFSGIATKQTWRRVFVPIRPSIRTDSTGDRTHHARAEGWHRHIFRIRTHVQHRLMMAPQRTAVRAHVAERHYCWLRTWIQGTGSRISKFALQSDVIPRLGNRLPVRWKHNRRYRSAYWLKEECIKRIYIVKRASILRAGVVCATDRVAVALFSYFCDNFYSLHCKSRAEVGSRFSAVT